MSTSSEHWQSVYERRAPTEVSWFQVEAQVSLELVAACGVSANAAIIDIGAGASTFVDGLLARGFSDITLLDIADAAFAATRSRLPSAEIAYVAADITQWSPPRTYDVWHDRAVFHFLTEPSERRAYRDTLMKALPAGAHAILGTFALDGPERCSGLPVQRYSAVSLALEFEGVLRLVEERSEHHRTPTGAEQSFLFARFARV